MVGVPSVPKDLLRTIGGWAKPAAAPTGPKPSELAGLDPETYALQTLKQGFLNQVRDEALAKGEQPTLEQYRLACVAYGETEEGKAATAAGKWSERIAADLSNLKLDGYRISEPKKQAAYQVQADYDANDRDGDHKITVHAASPFYDNVCFNEAKLENCFIEPATSFNEEIAKAESLNNITFNDMRENDNFSFAKSCNNITLSNVSGGTITVGESCQVAGLKIGGVEASLVMCKNSSVTHIEADDHTRIFTCDVKEGTKISYSDLSKANTFNMASKVTGVEFSHVSLPKNIDGVNFNNCTFNHCTFNGQPITKELLAANGAEVDGVSIKNAGPVVAQAPAAAPLVPGLDLGDLGNQLRGFEKKVADLKKGITAPTAEPATVAAAPEISGNAMTGAPTPKIAILFDGEASLNTVGISTQVAQMKRTVPENEQAQGPMTGPPGSNQA